VRQFKLVFTKEGAKNIGGFGTMGSIFPTSWDWMAFWSLTAFFSVALAFMNILPIPALDGGHLFFVLYEMVTRRKPSDKTLERAQYVGFAIVLALLVLANANDLYRFVIKPLFE
jgi:regulator of sigma E protease